MFQSKQHLFNTMINRSKKESPQQWKKWKESGATGIHPDAYRKKQTAELQIDPPEPLHRNWMISFRSEGKTKEWRNAYVWTIMDMATKRNWEPFFQSGSRTEIESWQMVELWRCEDSDELPAFLEAVQKRVEQVYPELFVQ